MEQYDPILDLTTLRHPSDRARALMKLVNSAVVVDSRDEVSTPMTATQAADHLARSDLVVDRAYGRSLFIDLSGDRWNCEEYDRQNGRGLARTIVEGVSRCPTPLDVPADAATEATYSIRNLSI